MCFDRSSNVRYPHHAEYVGTRSDLRGRCVRCHEVTDASIAGPSPAELMAQHDAAYRRWAEGVETAEDRAILGYMS